MNFGVKRTSEGLLNIHFIFGKQIKYILAHIFISC